MLALCVIDGHGSLEMTLHDPELPEAFEYLKCGSIAKWVERLPYGQRALLLLEAD